VKSPSGKFIRLDPDEEKAHRIWMAMVETSRPINHPDVSFATLANHWLGEAIHSMSQDRFSASARYIGQFADWVEVKRAIDITPTIFQKWLKEPKKNNEKHKGKPKPWSLSTKRDAAQAVTRVMRWAVGIGVLSRNPLAGLKMTTPEPRERLVTREEHKLLIDTVRGQRSGGAAFAVYLIASGCGARPQQIREVTTANVTADCSVWVFRKHKTAKKTKKPLTIYLTPCLQTLTRILMSTRKTGNLFRQESGKPWTKDGVGRRLRRTCDNLKLTGIVAYSYRHTFATDCLVSEIPIATVSAMLGHRDTRMVSQVYGHLDQHEKHLIEAAAKMSRKRHET
jgi:integrase